MVITGENMVREIKELATVQDDLKSDNMGSGAKIALETQNIVIIERDIASEEAELNNIKSNMESVKAQEAFLRNVRENHNKSHLLRVYFRRYVTDMEPDNNQMTQAFEQMQASYTSLLEKYEQRPEYRQVVEAENINRQLTQLLEDKRNELMRIETEREF